MKLIIQKLNDIYIWIIKKKIVPLQMRMNLLKTRRGKLKEKIRYELAKAQPDLDAILIHIDEYEEANLATIEKLKKEKQVDTKKINGALKQTINAHGPITKILIGSATKRIYGALMVNKKPTIIDKIKKWLKGLK